MKDASGESESALKCTHKMHGDIKNTPMYNDKLFMLVLNTILMSKICPSHVVVLNTRIRRDRVVWSKRDHSVCFGSDLFFDEQLPLASFSENAVRYPCC